MICGRAHQRRPRKKIPQTVQMCLQVLPPEENLSDTDVPWEHRQRGNKLTKDDRGYIRCSTSYLGCLTPWTWWIRLTWFCWTPPNRRTQRNPIPKLLVAFLEQSCTSCELNKSQGFLFLLDSIKQKLNFTPCIGRGSYSSLVFQCPLFPYRTTHSLFCCTLWAHERRCMMEN